MLAIVRGIEHTLDECAVSSYLCCDSAQMRQSQWPRKHLRKLESAPGGEEAGSKQNPQHPDHCLVHGGPPEKICSMAQYENQ